MHKLFLNSSQVFSTHWNFVTSTAIECSYLSTHTNEANDRFKIANVYTIHCLISMCKNIKMAININSMKPNRPIMSCKNKQQANNVGARLIHYNLHANKKPCTLAFLCTCMCVNFTAIVILINRKRRKRYYSRCYKKVECILWQPPCQLTNCTKLVNYIVELVMCCYTFETVDGTFVL